MNGNIVKIVDENNIEREAKIINTFNQDNIEYVIYSISRDGENSNIFVSRLVDGKFVDIVDANEKNKLNDIVKDMIKKAVE